MLVIDACMRCNSHMWAVLTWVQMSDRGSVPAPIKLEMAPCTIAKEVFITPHAASAAAAVIKSRLVGRNALVIFKKLRVFFV